MFSLVFQASSSSCSSSISPRLTRLICLVIAMFAGVPASVSAQSASPGGSSPKPLTPEQRLAAARSALARSHTLVKQTWTQLKQSRDQLTEAQKAYDELIVQLREENTVDPLIRDAAAKVNEARSELNNQRTRALSPLRLSFRFTRLQREHAEREIELNGLISRRSQAQRERLPFDPRKNVQIGELSLDVMRLRDDLASMEDELLDNHEGYQAASTAMDEALTQASEAMKATRELREGNPRKQAAHKAMMDAWADALAKGKAYAEARRARQQAGVAVIQAQVDLDRAKR